MTTVIGEPVRLSYTFTDDNGDPVDPAVVTLTITLPDTTVITHTPTHDRVGSYSYDYTTTLAGQHRYYFTGTAPNAGVSFTDAFTVAALGTAPLLSLGEAKTFNQIKGSSNDAQLTSFILTATAIVNTQCGYTIPTQFTEIAPVSLDAGGRGSITLTRTPVLSVTSITPARQNIPQSDITTLVIDADAGVIWLGNWYSWFGPQTVVYTAGRSSVPEELKAACQVIVAWLWETQRGGGTAIPNQGGEDVQSFMGLPNFPVHALAGLRMAGRYAAPSLA